MNNIFDSFKITIFELVGYVLPGLFLELLIYLFLFPSDFVGFTSHLPLLLILSYPLGQLLHSVSNVLDYDLGGLGWKIYHLIKEKDKNGHGVEDPQTRLGKRARSLRRLIEEYISKSAQSDVDKLLKEKLKLCDISGFDLFFLKESILAESGNIATNFEHLHYQKIFNKSLAFIFVVLLLISPFFPSLGIDKITLSSGKNININQSMVPMMVIAGVLYKIFYERAKFFKSYRDKIMNSAVRMYLEIGFSEKRFESNDNFSKSLSNA